MPRNRTASVFVAVLVAAWFAAGCTSGDDTSATFAPTTRTPTAQATQPHAPAAPVTIDDVQSLASGLEAPWSIAFLPSGDALVSQRDSGTLLHVTKTGEASVAGTVRGVQGAGESGLLGITFSPDEPSTLYAYATIDGENHVLRATYDDNTLGEFETVFDGIPGSVLHDGGRLAFGPDGMLYVSTGDAQDPASAQDLSSNAGKILRITPDGEVPDDNPFEGSPVYSYGHRNVQGLAFDQRGQLWASEFGADDFDEFNRIVPGGNYGWPVVEGMGDDERFIEPEVVWSPEEASPSGLVYVDGTFFMATLQGESLIRLESAGDSLKDPEVVIDQYGRLRDVTLAPDGSLWVLTNNTDGRGDPGDNDDQILRITLTSS